MELYKGFYSNVGFEDEADFKAEYLRVKRKELPRHTFFEIENEEKEPGMPDCLVIAHDPLGRGRAAFIEFKISDKKGVITFENSQPLFYKRNVNLFISILAWDVRFNRVVYVDPEEVIGAKSLKIRIPEILGSY